MTLPERGCPVLNNPVMSDIGDFPLLWRWTQSTHALFSAVELAALQPLPPEAAAQIFDGSLRFLNADSLAPEHFERVFIASADVPVIDGCGWLRARFTSLDEQVTLSWDRSTALQTTWGFFTARWDDFCYPASDDVLILPKSDRWVLLYHHEEEFHFARRRPGSSN